MIGSPLKLGQWKTEGALKLSYAGESVWVAESVLKKDELPIKYPLFIVCSQLLIVCCISVYMILLNDVHI